MLPNSSIRAGVARFLPSVAPVAQAALRAEAAALPSELGLALPAELGPVVLAGHLRRGPGELGWARL